MKRARQRYEQLNWFDQCMLRCCVYGTVVTVLLTGTLAVWLESWEFAKLGGGIMAFILIIASITFFSPTDG